MHNLKAYTDAQQQRQSKFSASGGYELSARPKFVSKFAAVDIKTVFAPSSITSTQVLRKSRRVSGPGVSTHNCCCCLRVMTEKRLYVAFCHPDLGLGGDH